MREFMMLEDIKLQDSLKSMIGSHFSCSMFTVNEDNATEGFTKLLEYHPMINSRVHRLGGSDRIVN